MKQVRPKKNLGQHFLTDLSVARRIADTVDSCPELPVLEVGPGMGVLTQFLAEKPRPLAVVEIDAESVAYLKEKYGWEVITNIEHQAEVNGGQMRDDFDGQTRDDFGGQTRDDFDGQIWDDFDGQTRDEFGGQTRGSAPTGAEPQIIANDFLRMDLRKLFGGGQFVLTGNYPYDISSQIFFKMLDNRDLIPCCTGMIQHEVALRMAAPPGNKQYGILSVLIQAWYDVEYLFTVEPSVFNPPPKVQSAVIRLTRNQTTHLGCDEQLFRRVVKATFGQRRKMLRVSLRQLFDAAHPASSAFFQQDMMTRRPEQLTITEFVELTNMVAEECVR